MKKQITFKAAEGDPKKAEILLYGDVGGFWDGGITAERFASSLGALGAVAEINLRINSSGGDIFEGFAIYNLLNRHSAKIVVDIDGVAASIASVIAMAGDEIRMAENAMLMIHDPWTVVAGSAVELRSQADVLDKLKASVVGVYAARTDKGAEELSALMSAETWYTAAEAEEAGFADSVTANKEGPANLAPERFRNVPRWAIRAGGQAGEAGPPDAAGQAWRLNLARRYVALQERKEDPECERRKIAS